MVMKDILSVIIAEVLNTPAEKNKIFGSWSRIDRFGIANIRAFGKVFEKVYDALKADYTVLCNIRKPYFSCDAYFGGDHRFIFEYDTLIDFNSYRESTLQFYPEDLKLNYDREEWLAYCAQYKQQADCYQYSQKVNGFEGPGGKAAKRALVDFLKDSQPYLEGLNPTLRICEFEIAGINSDNPSDRKNYLIIEKLLKKKLKH